jgi:thiamine-phosphate pyrophosphorylase
VHVGQDDVPPSAARDQLGRGAIVGFSTHSAAQADAALAHPVSYIAVGPVFGTRTKDTGYIAVGLELVRSVAALASGGPEGPPLRGVRPVVAIGGITLDTAASVIGAGAAAVAVITDLLATGDPVARTRDYVRCLTDIAYSRRTSAP